MKYITHIFKRIFLKELPKPMGRWKIDYCNVKLDNKIDLSNEDHCGTCGQYAITKIILQNKIIVKDKNDINIKSLYESK
jgi:hypothetical protein